MTLVIWAYIVFVTTYVLGIIFFFTYDLRKRRLPPSFLALHLGLTVLTFIMFSAAMAPGLQQQYSQPAVGTGAKSSLWENLHRHDDMLHQTPIKPVSKGATP